MSQSLSLLTMLMLDFKSLLLWQVIMLIDYESVLEWFDGDACLIGMPLTDLLLTELL
jgi:hypothetical protein